MSEETQIPKDLKTPTTPEETYKKEAELYKKNKKEKRIFNYKEKQECWKNVK